jgi:hypothetical protein
MQSSLLLREPKSQVLDNHGWNGKVIGRLCWPGLVTSSQFWLTLTGSNAGRSACGSPNFTTHHAQQNLDEEFDLGAAGEDVEFDEMTAQLETLIG